MKKYLVLICFSTLSHLFAFDTLVGIMVEFQTDVDPETSGDGTFLQIEDLDRQCKDCENLKSHLKSLKAEARETGENLPNIEELKSELLEKCHHHHKNHKE